MALYAYTRVSTQAQADDGQSLEVQGRQLDGWALMTGQTIATTFVERAVSGSVPIKDREAGGKLWAKLQRGDVVVAAKLDRMFRSALDALQMVEELKERGVALVLLDLSMDPITNGLGKMFLTIAAAFAEAERDRIRERVATVKRDQRDRGRYLGGKIPYGFTVDAGGALQPVEAEQAVVERVKALKASGAVLRAIQADIEREHGRRLGLATLSRLVA